MLQNDSGLFYPHINTLLYYYPLYSLKQWQQTGGPQTTDIVWPKDLFALAHSELFFKKRIKELWLE